MYKLIIADDEKMIREGITALVDWNKLGYEIVGCFSDGIEVIEYIREIPVDVVFTDIKMIGVSGIDIARYVHENKIHTKVVFVSGYKEFDLALQGIKYGVEDYLIKPIDVHIIKQTFTKIYRQLKDVYIEQKRVDEALPIIKESFFSQLILGIIDDNVIIKNKIALIYPNLEIEQSYCALIDINIMDYKDYMSKWNYSYDQFEDNIKGFIEIYKGEAIFEFVYKSDELIELFIILNKSIDKKEVAERILKDQIINFLDELSEIFKFKSKYIVKKTFNNLYEIVSYRETLFDSVYQNSNSLQMFQEQKKILVSTISSGNINIAQKLFVKIMDELISVDLNTRNNLVIELFSSINALIQNINQEMANSLQGYFNYSRMASMTQHEELKKYGNRIFSKIKQLFVENKQDNTYTLIEQIKGYILENITEDLSREDTANKFYISSAYLSRIFKAKTGENFSQYVTRIKMNKAVELLQNPQYKVYQISEDLGYKKQRHFTKLFRSYTGLNPGEYRSKILNLGEEIADEII